MLAGVDADVAGHRITSLLRTRRTGEVALPMGRKPDGHAQGAGLGTGTRTRVLALQEPNSRISLALGSGKVSEMEAAHLKSPVISATAGNHVGWCGRCLLWARRHLLQQNP